jgi:hypothetical protein
MWIKEQSQNCKVGWYTAVHCFDGLLNNESMINIIF